MCHSFFVLHLYCKSILYHANAFCQSLWVEFSRLIFVDLETARSAMARTRRRVRRHEMAECPFLIGRGWKRLKSSGCLQHFWFCWWSGTLTLKLKVRVLPFLKIEDGCENHITFLTTPPSEKSDTLPQTLYKIFFHFRKKYLESRCWNSRHFSYAGFCSNRAASSLSAASCSTFFSTWL